MIKPICMGVVGAGYWGPNLARNIASLQQTELSYICDVDKERLEKIASIYPLARCTTKLDDLLESDIEAVAIATPVKTHYQIAKKFLAAGKHVLIEKPMTRSSKEAENLLDLAKKKNLILMVDHTFNYTSAVKKIKELISKKELGELMYWDSVRISLGLFQHDVNVLWDLAVHDLAIMDYVISEKPISVRAIGMTHYTEGIENIAYISLKFNKSFIAHFHVNWLSPVKIRQILIGGKNKMLLYDDMLTSEKMKIYNKGVDIEETKEGVYKKLVQYRLGDMYSPYLQNTEALNELLKHFVDVVRHGKKPISGGDSGLRVIKILEAAQKSIVNNGREIIL